VLLPQSAHPLRRPLRRRCSRPKLSITKHEIVPSACCSLKRTAVFRTWCSHTTKKGIYSACLGASTLLETVSEAKAAPQATRACEEAGGGGGLPTVANILARHPLQHHALRRGRDPGTKPYLYGVFCNEDGTVRVCPVWHAFVVLKGRIYFHGFDKSTNRFGRKLIGRSLSGAENA